MNNIEGTLDLYEKNGDCSSMNSSENFEVYLCAKYMRKAAHEKIRAWANFTITRGAKFHYVARKISLRIMNRAQALYPSLPNTSA